MRIATILALALALGGCATTQPTSPGLEKAVFEDIPAAEGMTYESGYGHKSRSGDLRTYTQVYVGSRRLEDVRRFYEEAMPVHKWVQVSAEGADPVTLTFDRRAERVVVTIGRSGTLLKVTVKVGGRN